MNLNHIEVEYAIYGLLFSLSNRIQKIGDGEFEDITLKQHFLLAGLQMFENPPTLKEMEDLIGCSYQNIKRMALQLEKSGYLKLVQDEQDKRKLLLVATDKVKEVEQEKEEITIQFMNRLFGDISKEDLSITLRTLMKMDHNIGGVIK